MANSGPLESAVPDLSGQVVIVTGGARGVGRGITLGFLAAGADVTICGRSEPESLPEVGGRAAASSPPTCATRRPSSASWRTR